MLKSHPPAPLKGGIQTYAQAYWCGTAEMPGRFNLNTS